MMKGGKDMKKKLLALALLTASASAFAAPISTPVNVNDTPIIGGNNGTCGTVDLTNATSDYELKPCETAIIRFNNQSLVPLHIAVPEPSSPNQPVIYEITMVVYWTPGKNMDIDFLPNNSTYSNQFQILTYEHGRVGWARAWPSPTDSPPLMLITDRFYFDTYNGLEDTPPYIGKFEAVYYGANYPKHMIGNAFSNMSVSLTSAVWNNITTQWTSLGTFECWQSMSGQIIVKRIS
jgi:hypothetical protein